ncbi:N-acetyl-D-Glu racemase DgcA [Allomesorhizobium camelthorni]|uniref:Dipeptide epimerase n=1 Tax=Allomesorhizobium camelthorni TaxID=475069 RepID=A0A6G4WE43_9HYPH|nr:N-acetyl-D-Glu racemase DgcA [Mesorhizobium camelthorni]NGO52608.1 dipeptide epimerase [Mesorhizobium camelthorni]
MQRDLLVESQRFPIAGTFTISRGSKTEAEVICCMISEGHFSGRGECVPYRRYGETMESVIAAIEVVRGDLANRMDRGGLLRAMPAGAARNALDCALWDLEAKMSGKPAHTGVCAAPRAITTAYTLSLGTPEAMAAQAAANAARPLLKVKIGGENDIERIRAVVAAAPNSKIILDANEGWTDDNIEANLAAAAELGIALIEQPLPAGQDEILRRIDHAVPICADESVHEAADLEKLRGLYDAVNIKLDKAGGLTAAILLRNKARELGLSIMVGCMVGTSLAMAPAVLLAQDADFVDLDGPLLLARDRSPGLVYQGSIVSPPEPALWG